MLKPGSIHKFYFCIFPSTADQARSSFCTEFSTPQFSSFLTMTDLNVPQLFPGTTLSFSQDKTYTTDKTDQEVHLLKPNTE